MAKVEFKAAWKALKARASPDGEININSVDLNGKLDASYANPNAASFSYCRGSSRGEQLTRYSLSCALAVTVDKPTRSTMMLLATA